MIQSIFQCYEGGRGKRCEGEGEKWDWAGKGMRNGKEWVRKEGRKRGE
jgi:hypothetical protein